MKRIKPYPLRMTPEMRLKLEKSAEREGFKTVGDYIRQLLKDDLKLSDEQSDIKRGGNRGNHSRRPKSEAAQ